MDPFARHSGHILPVGDAFLRRARRAKAGAASSAVLDGRPPSFSAIAKRTMPVVVNISTTAQRSPRSGSNDPIDEFFSRFFGDAPPRESSQRSLGSGILISQDGEILTSYHVVRDADAIKVKLADQTEYEARLIGKDDRTDLALIKIRKSGGNLPFARLGSSSQLDVGDWVMAIGNPFGLEHTVTAGIVSAKGRVIGAGPYDKFIQTDASINPGNSGGPLINASGDVVGVNSAIFSQSGGNVGIGFAVPIDLAKKVVDQLRKEWPGRARLVGHPGSGSLATTCRVIGADPKCGRYGRRHGGRRGEPCG